MSEWSLSTLPSPILELQHAPLPFQSVASQGACPDSLLFCCFLFGTHIWVLRGVGNVSTVVTIWHIYWNFSGRIEDVVGMLGSMCETLINSMAWDNSIWKLYMMWTMHDLLAYDIVVGVITKGYWGCPCCGVKGHMHFTKMCIIHNIGSGSNGSPFSAQCNLTRSQVTGWDQVKGLPKSSCRIKIW